MQATSPIRWEDLERTIKDRVNEGVSLCIQTMGKSERRGGCFFHIKKVGSQYSLRTFDRDDVIRLDTEGECVEFINHVAGLAYSERMWEKAQIVNLRTDPID